MVCVTKLRDQTQDFVPKLQHDFYRFHISISIFKDSVLGLGEEKKQTFRRNIILFKIQNFISVLGQLRWIISIINQLSIK